MGDVTSLETYRLGRRGNLNSQRWASTQSGSSGSVGTHPGAINEPGMRGNSSGFTRKPVDPDASSLKIGRDATVTYKGATDTPIATKEKPPSNPVEQGWSAVQRSSDPLGTQRGKEQDRQDYLSQFGQSWITRRQFEILAQSS